MGSNGNRISVHHIGGRYGDNTFPVPLKFGEDISNVFYEADKDCLAQIQGLYKNRVSECQVLPYCLSDTCKATSFYINYDPFTSSIYGMNPDYSSYYSFINGHDYIISEVTKVMETRPIETVTMDSILQVDSIPTPDILSIDTQGSEYDILVGARETVKSSVLAMILETVFHPINQSNIVFGDLVKLLAGQGFHFVRFLSIDEASPFRGSIGLRGQGFHMAGDVLFLKKIEDIDNELMLWKLAFIAIVFNQFEYGLACLRQSKGLAKQAEEPVYIRFLRELMTSMGKMQEIFPYTFTTLYPSFESSNARFTEGYVPPAVKVNKMYVDESIRTQGWTEVEMVLNRYGLEAQANLLRKNRVMQMRTVM